MSDRTPTQRHIMTSSALDYGWAVAINLFTDREWLGREYHPVEVARLGYRSHAMAESIRLKWDSKFKAFKAPRSQREIFKLEGMLWHRVVNLIQEVFLLDRSGYLHPSTWFTCIALELKLIGPFAPDQGKELFIKQLRFENKQLLTHSNPFDRSSSPHTWKLIERAIDFAGKRNFDIFRTGTYTPMVKARMALITCIAGPESLVLKPTSQGVIAGRQRRKPRHFQQKES